MYTCVAENSAGRALHEAELRINGTFNIFVQSFLFLFVGNLFTVFP